LAAKRNDASALLVTLSLEFLAVGLFALIAGINDAVGSIMVLFVTGIFIFYLITNAKFISGLANAITQLSKNPADV
jgi:hypothetical protein